MAFSKDVKMNRAAATDALLVGIAARGLGLADQAFIHLLDTSQTRAALPPCESGCLWYNA